MVKLLCRDIEPKGNRLFLPFFTHNDLLRLSECSHGLLAYRLHLTRIKLHSPGIAKCKKRMAVDDFHFDDGDEEEEDHSPLVLKGVASVLAGQQRLEYLHASDLSIFPFLEGPRGCKVKTLVIPKTVSKSRDVLGMLGIILLRRGLYGIEELDCHIPLLPLMRAMAQGACPGLRKLIGEGVDRLSGPLQLQACEALATAIVKGHCQRLKELRMSLLYEHTGEVVPACAEPIARALKNGGCPDLSILLVQRLFKSLSLNIAACNT